MRKLHRIVGVAVLTSRWIIRQPLWLFQVAVFTLGFLILLFAWGGLAAVINLALLLVVSGFWTLGLNIVAQDYGWNRIMKLDEMFIASPVTLSDYFIGIILGVSLYNILFIASSALILLYLDLIHILPLLVMLGLIDLILGSFIGLIAVLRVRNPTNISAITNPLSTLTTILPPVYYPSTILPYPLNKVACIVPPATLMEVARGIAGLPTSLSPLESITIIIGWILLATLALSRLMTWGRE